MIIIEVIMEIMDRMSFPENPLVDVLEKPMPRQYWVYWKFNVFGLQL